mmetsp:Transcript_10329/g.19003  ORF Transcript_10329/g.19003 Transcript_10329/m.19003 type:complete len:150 (-) Transcript_10329:689-1138(-)
MLRRTVENDGESLVVPPAVFDVVDEGLRDRRRGRGGGGEEECRRTCCDSTATKTTTTTTKTNFRSDTPSKMGCSARRNFTSFPSSSERNDSTRERVASDVQTSSMLPSRVNSFNATQSSPVKMGISASDDDAIIKVKPKINLPIIKASA